MNRMDGRRTGLTICLMVGSALLLALVLAFAPAAGARGSPDGVCDLPVPEPAHVPPDVDFAASGGNPVLEPGPTGSWDESILWPAVVYQDGVTYLFYTGAFRWPNGPTAIGYASSIDGLTFRPSPDNPILSGDENGFDSWSVGAPVVLVEGNTWIMYYFGTGNLPHFQGYAIGRATAGDPAGPWLRDPNPVLLPGSDGEWDGGWVAPTSIVAANGTYTMYYMAGSAYHVRDIWMTGMATSTDGIEWTKYNDPATGQPPYAESDPVLMPGKLGAWDGDGAYLARVRQWRGGWELFYTGRDADALRSIGYAWSGDGISWVKHPHNLIPSLNREPTPDPFSSFDAPTVLVDGRTYTMYYGYLSNAVAWRPG